MRLDRSDRRMSHVFLCAAPFLAIIAAGVRPLRAQGVHHVIGAVLFTAICIAAWILGARVLKSNAQGRRQLGLAGALLVAPFAIIALMWVGLGPPWEATAAENQMRYLALIVMSCAVAIGFVVLKNALSESGEYFYSTLAFAAIILAGPLYLIVNTFGFGTNVALERTGQIPPMIASLNVVVDTLLSVGAALTYCATAAFATSLRRTEWLGRKAALAFIIVNFVALFCLVIRVLTYPDPAVPGAPWYTGPGFVVSIPAIPFIMPFLLGVVLLRRAGDEQSAAAA